MDEVAVIPVKQGQEVCTALVNASIDKIIKEYGEWKFYLVAKNSNIFKNMGFEIIQREDASSFSECFNCPDSQKNVFQK